METIAQKELGSQEELVKSAQKDVKDYRGRIAPEEFWEEIGRRIREGIRVTCRFWSKPATRSGKSCHPFWSKPATHSG